MNGSETRRLGRAALHVTRPGLGTAPLGDLFVRVSHEEAIAAVIPGAVSADQVRQNLRRFSMDIPATMWDELKAEGLLRVDAPVPI